MNYESLRKYKVGIYMKFQHMLRGKIFKKKAKNHLGGRNYVTRVNSRTKTEEANIGQAFNHHYKSVSYLSTVRLKSRGSRHLNQ